jgi:protein TonB
MNIKRHVLPASVAAVLHTALLLLVPSMPAPAIFMTPHAPPPAPHPPDNPPFVPPADDDDPVVSPTQCQRGSQRPEIPDPPIDPMNHTEFRVDVQPVIFRPSPLAPPGPPGPPDGVINGIAAEHAFVSAIDLDRTPRPTAQIPPDYPSALRQAGIGGEVLVEFSVDATGRVLSARVLKSTRREFEEPTLRAVQRWHFEPGKRNGRAVPFRMVVPVDFSVGSV